MLEVENHYKEVPTDTSYLRVDMSWCGDNYCNCHYGDIWAVLKDKTTKHIWSSNYYGMYDYSDKEGLDELRKEIKEACEYYGIKVDTTSNCVWDWKGYRYYE
jgi:hypothetical protein